MGDTADALTVLLVADQQAIADAVSAALSVAGCTVTSVADGLPVGDPSRSVGLLLHALAPEAAADAALAVLAGPSIPWLVVASTPRGPGWDAAYAAGASTVVDAAETSVEQVLQLLRAAADGSLAAPQTAVGPATED